MTHFVSYSTNAQKKRYQISVPQIQKGYILNLCISYSREMRQLKRLRKVSKEHLRIKKRIFKEEHNHMESTGTWNTNLEVAKGKDVERTIGWKSLKIIIHAIDPGSKVSFI